MRRRAGRSRARTATAARERRREGEPSGTARRPRPASRDRGQRRARAHGNTAPRRTRPSPARRGRSRDGRLVDRTSAPRSSSVDAARTAVSGRCRRRTRAGTARRRSSAPPSAAIHIRGRGGRRDVRRDRAGRGLVAQAQPAPDPGDERAGERDPAAVRRGRERRRSGRTADAIQPNALASTAAATAFAGPQVATLVTGTASASRPKRISERRPGRAPMSSPRSSTPDDAAASAAEPGDGLGARACQARGLGGFEGVPEQHRDRHRADAARDGVISQARSTAVSNSTSPVSFSGGGSCRRRSRPRPP